MATVNDAAPTGGTRRRFLTWLWAGLGLGATGELVWIASGFLRPRSPKSELAEDLLTAGPVDAFPPGSVTAFPAGRFYLVRLTDGGFLALNRECTHLGCTVPYSLESETFDCPCHASSFAIDGAVLGPPANRPLDRHPVRIENGIVKVEIGRLVERTSVSPTEAVHA